MIRSVAAGLAVLIALGCGSAVRAQTPDDSYNQGVRALAAQEFVAAQQAFSALVQQRPSASNYAYLAMAQVGGGNLKPGIVSFRKVIALGGDSANLRYNLAVACLDDHQSVEGIRQLEKAISLDPKYIPARYALGVAYLDAAQPAKAILYLEEVRRSTPHDPAVWANLVNARFAAGNDKAAIDIADKAVQAIPDDPRLAVTLATICMHHGEAQTARSLLEDANESMPNNDDVRFLLAKASLIGGEPVEALAVLKADPQDGGRMGEQLVLRGQAKALTGDSKGAEEDFLGALKQAPGNIEYLTTYAWFQQLQGRHADAISTLGQAQQVAPSSPEVLYRMAVSYYFSGQSVPARKMCEDTLRLSPAFTPAYLLLGNIEIKDKAFPAAERNFRKAVELRPAEGLFHRELGEALLDGQNAAEARKQLDIALKLNPKDGEAYVLKATLLAQQGETAQAIADLKLALEFRPGDPAASSQLAGLYTAQGRPDLADGVLAQQSKDDTSPRPAQDDPLLTSLPGSNM